VPKPGWAPEHAALEEERKTVGRRLKTELEEFRRATRERLQGEVERLREQVEQGRRRGLPAEAVERLFAEAPELVPAPERPPEGELAVGRMARHARFGWQGVVERLDDGRAEVLVRGKRLRCSPEELVPVTSAEAAAAAGSARAASRVPERRREAAGSGRDAEESTAAPAEINLIGRRVEPALEELDAYLDQALRSSRREVRVVHGHGTGRLRQAVREHLRTHRGVASQRPGEPNEGGNGATVVTLRGA
jgi:DNA mismatch repair protein MutS2